MRDRRNPHGSKPASRRGRPPVISDDRLLEAAREVFLARGIRATTAEVADRAHVSEGTIFHRYKTKDALFRAAMRFDPDKIPSLMDFLAPRADEVDLRSRLVGHAMRILSFGRVAVPMMMMAWSNPDGEYSLEKLLVDEMRAETSKMAKDRWFRGVKALFDSEMECGGIARVSSEILTRMFIGTLRDYCFRELLIDVSPRMSPEEFSESVVDMILRAARPEAALDAPSSDARLAPRARHRARAAR
jgi:AcrR family transcriptional regulator